VARILVVDDDHCITELLQACLQTAGHECLVADSGEKGFDRAKEDNIDLLVLDVMLPGGVSGFETCRRIRADEQLCNLPILMLSAMSDEEEIIHGLAQGADDYVAKPFDLQNLLRHCDALLKDANQYGLYDDFTALPGASAIKREVQKCISRQDHFSLACVELARLREFGRHSGPEARQKTIRHLSRALTVSAQGMYQSEFVLGHMGGGYFICIMPPNSAEEYIDRVLTVWDNHIPSLYEQAGIDPSLNPGQALLKLLVCMTTYHRKQHLKSQDVFETLVRLRLKALAEGTYGLHFDRRQ